MEGTFPDILLYRTDDYYHSNVLPRAGHHGVLSQVGLKNVTTKLVEVTEFQKSYLKY